MNSRYLQALSVGFASLISFFSSFSQESNQITYDNQLDSLLNIKVSVASKYWQNISDAPASITIITARQIQRYGYTTLDEVLRTVRGFYTSYDRNYSYVGIRGFSRPTDYNDRLVLLLNGHTMNENVYGSMFAGSDLALDMETIDHIEIVRGPGSSLYGTGAMLGIINLITKKGKTIDGAKIGIGGGSYGRIEGDFMYGKEFDDGSDLFLSIQGVNINGQDLYFKEFDSPSTNFGIAHDLDYEQLGSVFGKYSYKDFSVFGSMSSRKKGVPTASYGTTFNAPDNYSIDKRAFLETKYSFDLTADKSLTTRGYFDWYKYEGKFPYSVLSMDASTGLWYGVETRFQWDIFANNRFTAGVEYKKNERADYINSTTDTVYFDQNFPYSIFSLSVQDEYQINQNLTFTLGLRRDEYSIAGSSTTPRAALIYYPNQTSTIKLLYSEGFRVPNIYETYYQDPLSGAKDNLALKPEKITMSEAVWEQRVTDFLYGVVSLYSYTTNDLIDQQIDPIDSLLQFKNTDSFEAQGIEIEINYKSSFPLEGYMNYSYQDPSKALLYINSPPRLLRYGLSYRISSKIFISTEMRYTDRRLTVYNTYIDPYWITNLTLQYAPKFSEESASLSFLNKIEASFQINNIFDVSYSTPGGYEHIQNAIPQDRRNYRARLEYTF